jgi:hypothetical protein
MIVLLFCHVLCWRSRLLMVAERQGETKGARGARGALITLVEKIGLLLRAPSNSRFAQRSEK